MLSRIKAWVHRADAPFEEMEHHREALKEERLVLGATEEEADGFASIKLGIAVLAGGPGVESF